MSYFEKLQHDLDTLGFTRYGDEPVLPRMMHSYGMLKGLMLNVSRKIAYARHPDEDLTVTATSSQLETSFAKRALVLCQMGLQPNYDETICVEAESRMVHAMDPVRIANSEKTSPVVVTRDNEAVGLTGHLGAISYYYALHDDTPSQTFEGHVYSRALGYSPSLSRSLVAPHAWNIPLDEMNGLNDGGGRLTIFTIPTAPRKDLGYLLKYEKVALNTSHQALIELAERALATSERIEVGSEVV